MMKKTDNRKKKNGKSKKTYEGLQERPTIWKLSLRHVGLPDVITMRVGVQCTVGGSGGATSTISNGIKLNCLGSATGNSFITGETLLGNYMKYRVLGYDLLAQISSKSAAPVNVVIAPSMDTTTPSTSTSNFESIATQRLAVRRVVGAVGSGKDVITVPLPFRRTEQVAGKEGELTNDYDSDGSSGTFGDPTILAYLWCVVMPTNGGSFTAATDPVISIRGSLLVSIFQKQLP